MTLQIAKIAAIAKSTAGVSPIDGKSGAGRVLLASSCPGTKKAQAKGTLPLVGKRFRCVNFDSRQGSGNAMEGLMGLTSRDPNSTSLDKFLEGSRLDVKAAISAWVRARTHKVLVLNLDEAAQRIDSTRRTIEREIAAGRGPAVVQITERKIGILEEDLAAWIRSRRRVAPSTPAEAGERHSPAPGKRRVDASKKANEEVAAE